MILETKIFPLRRILAIRRTIFPLYYFIELGTLGLDIRIS